MRTDCHPSAVFPRDSGPTPFSAPPPPVPQGEGAAQPGAAAAAGGSTHASRVGPLTLCSSGRPLICSGTRPSPPPCEAGLGAAGLCLCALGQAQPCRPGTHTPTILLLPQGRLPPACSPCRWEGAPNTLPFTDPACGLAKAHAPAGGWGRVQPWPGSGLRQMSWTAVAGVPAPCVPSHPARGPSSPCPCAVPQLGSPLSLSSKP